MTEAAFPAAAARLARIGRLARRFGADRRGATAIEYGLIASLVVIVIIAGVTGYGDAITAQWTWLANTILANVKSS